MFPNHLFFENKSWAIKLDTLDPKVHICIWTVGVQPNLLKESNTNCLSPEKTTPDAESKFKTKKHKPRSFWNYLVRHCTTRPITKTITITTIIIIIIKIQRFQSPVSESVDQLLPVVTWKLGEIYIFLIQMI